MEVALLGRFHMLSPVDPRFDCDSVCLGFVRVPDHVRAGSGGRARASPRVRLLVAPVGLLHAALVYSSFLRALGTLFLVSCDLVLRVAHLLLSRKASRRWKEEKVLLRGFVMCSMPPLRLVEVVQGRSFQALELYGFWLCMIHHGMTMSRTRVNEAVFWKGYGSGVRVRA